MATVRDVRPPGSIWWEPRQPDWWVAALFAVGSTCFLLGATPGYASLVGVGADTVTYFVGSIFFTGAAWLQLLVSVGAVRPGVRIRRAARWRALQRAPRTPEWWAGVVQFIGTLFFNVTTFAAMNTALTAEEAQRRVWVPDAVGSIAFLVASALAFAEVRRPWITWRPHDLAWSVTMLNMLGSIAFGLSAIGARYVDGTVSLENPQLANAGTWLGALCFLLGAVFLIPEELAVSSPAPGSASAAPPR